jgi:hypothetical protein
MPTLRLFAGVDIQINWDEVDTNSGISLMEDVSEEINIQEWSYGSGNGFEANDAYYIDKNLAAGETYTLNLQSLPRTALNLNLTRTWNKLKLLCIENINPSGELHIGSSGTANPVGLFGSDTKIGYSGIYSMSTPFGIDVDSTHKNINIKNLASEVTHIKILALGIRSG